MTNCVNLNEMTTKELKAMAKELQVKDWWTMKKDALIEAISWAIADKEDEGEEVPVEEIAEEAKTEAEEPETAEDAPATICIKLNVPMSDEVKAKLDEIMASNSELFESYEEVVPKKRAKKESKHINEFEWNGQTKTVKEWAKELGMQWPALYDRINRNGWTIEEAMTIPVGGRRTKKTEA